MTDVLAAVDAIREAAPGYEEAGRYYRGEVDELFASPRIEKALAESGSGFGINLARRPVDAVLDRMRITSVRVPDDEDATEFLIEQVWNHNRLHRVAKLVHRAALTFGDAYLFVWPGEADGTVDVFYNSPHSVRAFYDPENPSRILYVAKMWCEKLDGKEILRVNLYYADKIEKWYSRAGTKAKQDSDFEQWAVDGEAWPVDNPYGRPPFFHFRGDEPYGRPEHRDAYGPQNALTKLAATQMGSTDYQGFPQRWAVKEFGPGGDATDYPDDDTMPDETNTRLDSGPGTVWDLPSGTKVGQFEPADVRNFLDPMLFWIRVMSSSTVTPARFLDPTGQIPSGEALRADDAPLSEKIADRQEWFDDSWVDSLVFALLVLGRTVPTVDVQWRPVQVIDDKEGWETVRTKVEAGVPTRQALAEAGYPPELVEEWSAGSEQSNLETRIGNLDRIAGAVQKLAAAVQLGGLDKSQVDTLISQTLGEMVQDGQP